MQFAFLAPVVILALGVVSCSKPEKVWIPGWKETSPLSTPRAGAAVTQVGKFIYVIGGVDGIDFLDSMEYAQINSDGSLGPWIAGPKLNVPRGFVEATAKDGWIYIVGGGNGPNGHNLLRSAERAKIKSDGSLEPWVMASNEMVLPRRCSKIVSVAGEIFSLGGFGGALLNSVERASINSGGELGAWQLDSEVMTIPRYVNGVKAINGSIYVVGGHDQNQGVGVNAVEWSRVNADGSLAKWQATQPLQVGRYALATASSGELIYALGGITGAEYTATVERARQTQSGELSAWETTTPLPYPLSNFSAITHDKTMYVIGGTNLTGYYRSVQYASLDEKGDLGFFGTEKEKQAFKAQQETASRVDLPNSGVVREVLNTQAYTYARVERPDGSETWLAGPKTAISPGARIRFSQGVLMTNFFSKELQRPFPEVIFVGTIAAE